MTQLALFVLDARQEIHLVCPSCGYGWLAAINEPGSWWGRPADTAHEQIASECSCPKCDTKPPMRVAA